MSHWADLLRQQARAQHSILLRESGGDASAAGLLAAAARLTGIHPEPVPAGDAMLDGEAQAVLDRAAESIFYNAEADPSILLLWLAHEYAHLWLKHGDCTRCRAEQIDLEASDEDIPLGVALVEGYSPEERREREANVYARELLLPCTLMREWYLSDGLGGAEISARTGLPEPLVYHQFTQALLTPERDESAALASKPLPGLDDTQAEAAHAPAGPLLVEAGPGTGKTRTLVARVEYLLEERGVEPASILCLTFSIKAAEEMRERIARVRPDDAMRMQIGTFHSFGLELLRKEGSRLGYPPRPRVLDPASALFVMERLLPTLGLSHYQYLYEPTANLRDLLDAISRAKDELCTPDQYRALAQAMRDKATSPDEVNRAERALEVANVYSIYQAELDRERMLDFGDLIYRAVDLLRAAPDLRADLGARFQHILVDEYQDVNRASGVLLEELSNENGGRGLWVVGDARQSIYRWRGASPANMRLFKEKFPGAAVKVLGVNYRSRKEVMDLVTAFAPTMRVSAGGAFRPWIADRGAGGHLQMEIAEDGPSEYLHIAQAIERRRVDEGTPYGGQAILCRSHTQLARVAAELERAGVPALYLGDLFERPEIRDMLSLLSLATQPDGRGLLRVARFPEYQVPLADALALIHTARDRSVPFPRALKLAEELDLSEPGKAGVRLIAAHLKGLCYGSTAWSMLVQYLFNRSAYLRLISADQSVASQQQRLALYQLLQFAHQTRSLENPDKEDPKRVFLEYVRHLEVFGEEKQLRNLPESAAALDAVRLLTVHASKGLQFPVVYVPSLGKGMFPAKKQGAKCPPPEGMIAGAGGDSHEEEEECLFFCCDLPRGGRPVPLPRGAEREVEQQALSPATRSGATPASRPGRHGHVAA
jgi:DNA helicase-2/ATP-dependent DNA helicase PcrA